MHISWNYSKKIVKCALKKGVHFIKNKILRVFIS
jgi:hypothetical protein